MKNLHHRVVLCVSLLNKFLPSFSSSIISILYQLMDEKSPICYIFPFFISRQVFPLFLLSSSTCPNHSIPDHSMGLLPSSFNCNALVSILGLSIFFTWTNHCSQFSSNSVNKFWIPTFLFLSKKYSSFISILI
jgi:hypothetical protein